MRYKEGKIAIIIDHVGNCFEHGLPDSDHSWSLDSKKKKNANKELIKVCPVCFAVLEPSESICPVCGHVFTPKQRADKVVVEDVELEEITAIDIIKAMPYTAYKTMTTFDEIKAFQSARGYKFGWTLHKCKEQQIEIPGKYNAAKRYLK